MIVKILRRRRWPSGPWRQHARPRRHERRAILKPAGISPGSAGSRTMAVAGAAAVCLLFALGAGPARAQESPGDVRAQVPTVLLLDVTNADPRFDNISAADFDAGYASPSNGASSLDHKGNVAHSVHIRADAAVMTGGDGDKPASDLEWSLDGGPWNALRTSDAALVSGANRGAHSGRTVAFRLRLSYEEDAPGIYTLNFTYTIIAN